MAYKNQVRLKISPEMKSFSFVFVIGAIAMPSQFRTFFKKFYNIIQSTNSSNDRLQARLIVQN